MVNTRSTPQTCGRRQHQFVHHAARRGHHHDEFLHPGHLGGNGVHQHRRGIGRLAARHVQPDPVQRRDLLARAWCRPARCSSTSASTASRDKRAPAPPPAAAPRAAPPADRRTPACRRAADISSSAMEAASSLSKRCGVFQHRGIAARFHVMQNTRHHLVDGFVLGAFEGQQLRAGDPENRAGRWYSV